MDGADEEIRDDMAGRALWILVIEAIKELQAGAPAPGVRVH
jgi:hypothetical protein